MEVVDAAIVVETTVTSFLKKSTILISQIVLEFYCYDNHDKTYFEKIKIK